MPTSKGEEAYRVITAAAEGVFIFLTPEEKLAALDLLSERFSDWYNEVAEEITDAE